MVIIRNKSNKPIGIIGGAYCLPDQKMEIKDKDAFCDVYDEDGVKTGEKQILPGLRAIEKRGYIEINIVSDKVKVAAEESDDEEPVEEPVVEKKSTRGRKKKAE